MSNNILVTGATGNIGSCLVKELIRAGEQVRAAVHTITKTDSLKAMGCEVTAIDFYNQDILEKVLKNIEKVFFVTPFVPDMVAMSKNFVKAAQKAGVKHIVRISGLGADAEPGITLGRWHREVEKIIENSGISYTFLRPNSFMQNYIVFTGGSIKNNNAFYMPLADAKISIVDVRDIAAVAAIALTGKGHEGKKYNITGPQAISNNEIAEIFSGLLGRKISYVNISDEDAKKSMLSAGLPEILVNCLLELYAVNKAGYTADIADTVEIITKRKPITFNQFARDNISFFK